ncbi:hypothetical protein [Nocardioides antri]|uniref:Uncharacterized protein n=1 Tax=Nocardioides antri TaxID=2607659 RepID=A0A5B1LWF1_9ACTN|nr:hypothetical protein [Nocardioides antri]KAA1424069.1 hypothetical protein F0U47_19685 [Nocardioides antri]
MPAPSDEVLPFVLSDGWPDPLPGCVVTFRESGIVLGSLLFEDDEWRALRSGPALSLRIDEHPVMDGWTTRDPDGTETHVEFEIPLLPVTVPPAAMAHSRAFEEWVWDTHGSLGRLLLWDEPRHWWIVQESDLELAITCAPKGMLSETSEALSWLSFGTEKGRQEVSALRERYAVDWAE